MRSLLATVVVSGLLGSALGATGTSTGTGTGPAVVNKHRPAQATISPSLQDILTAQATVKPSSPTSNVKGLAFDRIIQIWLENTNFQAAAGDDSFKWIASQGITLTNYFGTTHPSQPNYAASVAGDNFGMDHDDFFSFPANISTVADLLETKKISWGHYQEHMPYAGFQAYEFSNQQTGANDYVRKHNPLIMFESITNDAERTARIKNLTSFYDDLDKQQLPQWSFLTPNMTNDGHDTNYRFSGRWAKAFLEPLFSNEYLMNRTLVILSFDESEVYTIQNRIFTVLLGGAVDETLRGTSDATFYNHYSTLSTVSANWGLPSLGRWDCGSNILAVVANKTGYSNVAPTGDDLSLTGLFFNQSYPGPASDKLFTPGWWPVPDTTSACSAGNGVLQAVKDAWKGLPGPGFNYSDAFPYDARSGVDTAVPAVRGNMSRVACNATTGTTTGGPKGSDGAFALLGRTTVVLGGVALMLTVLPQV